MLASRSRALGLTLPGVVALAPLIQAVAAEPAHRPIASREAPAAIGPYSQAVLANGTLYVSGQIGLDPKSGRMAADDVAAQTRQAMANLAAVLAAAGMTFDDAVQAQVFLADLDDFAGMNEVYATFFKVPPARVTVQAARLPRDARIEIALIAVRRGKTAASQ